MLNIMSLAKNTTNVVIQQNSRKFLMMDILMSETCWAHKKWNNKASDIKLVFYSSTITMMHGPINMRLYFYLQWTWNLFNNWENLTSGLRTQLVWSTLNVKSSCLECPFPYNLYLYTPLCLSMYCLPKSCQPKYVPIFSPVLSATIFLDLITVKSAECVYSLLLLMTS